MASINDDIRYIAAAGSGGRALIARLRPGSDLIAGIRKLCIDFDIKNGYIPSCIGALHKTRYVYGVPDPTVKGGAGVSEEQQSSQVVQFLSAQGNICHDESGEPQVHIHGVFCDQGLIKGGHFDQPGNIVAATMELVIQEVLGVDMALRVDSEIDQLCLDPYQSNT
jgi:predicted DNA-binding protein with PD1-like motif